MYSRKKEFATIARSCECRTFNPKNERTSRPFRDRCDSMQKITRKHNNGALFFFGNNDIPGVDLEFTTFILGRV